MVSTSVQQPLLAFIGSAYTVYTIECSLQQPAEMVKWKEKGQGLC